MSEVIRFTDEQLQRICDVLANSDTGLTGSEIGTYLLRLEVSDPGARLTKRLRLYEALHARQNRDRSGGVVLSFIQATMDPGRYIGNAALFERRRFDLNGALGSCGYELRADGHLQFAPATAATAVHRTAKEALREALAALPPAPSGRLGDTLAAVFMRLLAEPDGTAGDQDVRDLNATAALLLRHRAAKDADRPVNGAIAADRLRHEPGELVLTLNDQIEGLI